MNPRILFILFSLSLVFFFGNCDRNNNSKKSSLPTDIVNNPNTANGKVDQSDLPFIQFEETEHDFGRILEGETVSFSFKFTNKGKSDLVIADVSTSCGCTVPSFPKTPVRPGEENIIKVAFNSTGKRGYQSKNIVVVANTQPNTTLLRIKAQVVTPGSEK
ncbi:MAG: DUF1573 domain-containing protein [Bacteroidales bacterium]|nr:DUF1573 domain-containing protein [Bacteroidales bacterium]